MQAQSKCSRLSRCHKVVRELQMRPIAPELADPLNTGVIVSSFDN